MTSDPPVSLHASAVAVEGVGVLIVGRSGSGKSTLALEMMAFGAALIADDLVIATRSGPDAILSPPARREALIEARGIGLISGGSAVAAPCRFIVDLDLQAERLPGLQTRDLLGLGLPLIFGKDRTGLAAILMLIARRGPPRSPDCPVAKATAHDDGEGP